MKTLHIPCDPGEISDGYHTFNELYDHRCTLFLALMASNPALSWISAKHHDGSEWEGWFIAGMELPTGDVTYHLPNSMMGEAMQTGCRVLDCGKEWDGHTAADVVKRLREWVHSANVRECACCKKAAACHDDPFGLCQECADAVCDDLDDRLREDESTHGLVT